MVAMAIGRHRLALLLVAAASLTGCGAGVEPDARVAHPILVVVNKCDPKMEAGEYVFPFKELRLHSAVNNYAAASNQLAAPLNPGEEVTLVEPKIQRGKWYVTVFRPTGPWQPQLVAVTGANPVDLSDGIYRLLVYEEAFYLYPPTRTEGPIRERGAPDRSSERRPVDASRPPDAGPLDHSTVQ